MVKKTDPKGSVRPGTGPGSGGRADPSLGARRGMRWRRKLSLGQQTRGADQKFSIAAVSSTENRFKPRTVDIKASGMAGNFHCDPAYAVAHAIRDALDPDPSKKVAPVKILNDEDRKAYEEQLLARNAKAPVGLKPVVKKKKMPWFLMGKKRR